MPAMIELLDRPLDIDLVDSNLTIDLVDRNLAIEVEDFSMAVVEQDVRNMKGTPRTIGDDEVVEYTLNIPTSWGTPVTPTTMKVYDKDATILVNASGGAPTIVDQVITFILLGTALRRGQVYKVRISFTVSGRVRSVVGDWRVTL